MRWRDVRGLSTLSVTFHDDPTSALLPSVPFIVHPYCTHVIRYTWLLRKPNWWFIQVLLCKTRRTLQ